MVDKEILSFRFKMSFDIPEAIRYDGYWVYHYTSPEGFMNILQEDGESNLWFTQYDSLNDMNERREFNEHFHKYCERKKEGKVFSNDFVSRVLEMSGSDICGISCYTNEKALFEDGSEVPVVNGRYAECDTYLCCFSSDADSLAMWNYYSKTGHYEGYNIRMLTEELKEISGYCKGYKMQMMKVIYDDKEKDRALDQVLLPAAELFDRKDEKGRKSILLAIQGAIDNLQFAFKNQCFAHEKEVRAVLRIPRKSKTNEMYFERKYRQKNGFIIPYIEFPLRSGIVDGVTMAPLLREEIAVKNTREFLSRRGHHVQVQSSQIPIRF